MPTREELQAWNAQVIANFRANNGQVEQPPFPILLLTTVGRRTGKPHTTPVGYIVADKQVYVIASSAGSPENPDWFQNLSTQPAVTVELGPATYAATAVAITGARRDRLYTAAAAANSTYNEYASATSRVLPVIQLIGVPAPTR